MTTHIALRLDDSLLERLDSYSDRHHLENRSQAIRHALRSILNLEEGETVALKPTRPVSKRAAQTTTKGKSDDEQDIMELARQAAKHGMTLEQYRAHLKPSIVATPTRGAYKGPGDDPAWQ